jgi:hypothetical protein
MKSAVMAIGLLIATSGLALCQKAEHNNGFMQGYIVKVNNDTVYGEVQFREESGRMLEKIRYRENKDADLKDYRPNEIKCFQLGRHFYFVLRGAYFQQISLGKVDVYERRNHIYIQNSGPGMNTTTRSDDEESHILLIDEDGEQLEYFNDGKLIKDEMKRRLAAYFKDAPQLVSKISKGYYTTADVLYMVYEYNEPGKYQLRPIDEHEYKKEKAPEKKGVQRLFR